VKYLNAFLRGGDPQTQATPALTELPKPPSVSSVSALPPLIREHQTPQNRRAVATPSLELPEPCDSCGRTDWRLSLVLEDGGRTCADCVSGLTALRQRGVPI
jgi:hypothetical protein